MDVADYRIRFEVLLWQIAAVSTRRGISVTLIFNINRQRRLALHITQYI